MSFIKKQETLYKLIRDENYTFSQGVWKKGNNKKAAIEIAELIISKAEDYSNKYELAAGVEALESVWDDLHATYNSVQSRGAREVLDKFLRLCNDKSHCSVEKVDGNPRYNIDDLIWGSPKIATRCGTGDEFYVLPITANGEYEEISDSLLAFKDNFPTRLILTKKGLIPRVAVFSDIVNALLKKFGVESDEFLTLEDLDFPYLSPTLLKSYLELVEIRNKDKVIIGYRLKAKPESYTLSTYYRDSYEYRLGVSDRVGELVPLSNNPQTPSFKYIDLKEFESVESDDISAYEGFMDTFRVPEARSVFFAWVYSILDSENISPQLLWLSSQGGTGKSSFINALSDILGAAVGTISDKDLESDFGLESVLNRRLIINADNKKPSIIHGEAIHNLTTGDKVTINRKNKSKFSANVYVKLLICSNTKPNLNIDENNQTRRVIYIEQLSPTDEELIAKGRLTILEDGTRVLSDNATDYKNKLIEQFPAFMKEAKKHYDLLCPARSVIAIPPALYETIEELNSTENYELVKFFEEEYDMKSSTDLKEGEIFIQSGNLKEDIINHSEEFKMRTRTGWYRVESLLKNKWGILLSKNYRHSAEGKTYKGVCGNKTMQSPIMGFVKKGN